MSKKSFRTEIPGCLPYSKAQRSLKRGPHPARVPSLAQSSSLVETGFLRVMRLASLRYQEHDWNIKTFCLTPWRHSRCSRSELDSHRYPATEGNSTSPGAESGPGTGTSHQGSADPEGPRGKAAADPAPAQPHGSPPPAPARQRGRCPGPPWGGTLSASACCAATARSCRSTGETTSPVDRYYWILPTMSQCNPPCSYIAPSEPCS